MTNPAPVSEKYFLKSIVICTRVVDKKLFKTARVRGNYFSTVIKFCRSSDTLLGMQGRSYCKEYLKFLMVCLFSMLLNIQYSYSILTMLTNAHAATGMRTKIVNAYMYNNEQQ